MRQEQYVAGPLDKGTKNMLSARALSLLLFFSPIRPVGIVGYMGGEFVDPASTREGRKDVP
jgi:hypothetical protein